MKQLVLLFLSTALTAGAIDLTGTWRLVSAAEWRPNGELVKLYGPKPVGQLMYDGKGNMAAQIQFDETNADGETYLAYFGTYKVDDAAGTVSHVVAASTRQRYRGTTQLRFVALDGDRLTLGMLPQMVSGEMRLRSLTWERVR